MAQIYLLHVPPRPNIKKIRKDFFYTKRKRKPFKTPNIKQSVKNPHVVHVENQSEPLKLTKAPKQRPNPQNYLSLSTDALLKDFSPIIAHPLRIIHRKHN